jgi:hypothetical protein
VTAGNYQVNIGRDANRAPRRKLLDPLVVLVAVALLFGLGASAANPTAVAAATGPKVAIIVGPNGSATAGNRDRANAAAAEALHYTSNVVKVYSPNATWARVMSAISGASIVVYFGRGRGFPSPYSSVRRTSTQDGFGLNPVAGDGNEKTRFYGEAYIRQIALAPNALVMLHPQAYASGSSEPGRTAPTLSVARKRVDNYGAGFLAVGAGAVIAETNKSVATWYIRRVFTQDASVAAIWKAAPTRHGHISGFVSTRTSGAVGRTDPVHTSSGFTRSIVGRLGTVTMSMVRGGIAAVAVPVSAPLATTSKPIVVTTDGVTIDGATITSSGSSGVAIHAAGTASNPVKNLTIKNCHLTGFNIGILAEHVVNLVIENCVIENAAYGGVMVYSGVGGTISNNTIRKIGYYTPLNTSAQNNAYGIALSRRATTSFTSDPRTSSFTVSGNLVEDVPYWHCYDTHAGQSITFSNNTARRCPRPFFITLDGIGTQPKSVTVTANRIEQALQVSGGTNKTAVTLVNLQGGSVTNNRVSTTYPTPWVYDYLGINSAGSNNVTISGQVSTP